MIIHDNLATFVNDKLLKIPGDGLWLLQGRLDFPLDSFAVVFGPLTLWGVRICLLSLRAVILFGLFYAFDWNGLLFLQKPEDGMSYLTVVWSLSIQGAKNIVGQIKMKIVFLAFFQESQWNLCIFLLPWFLQSYYSHEQISGVSGVKLPENLGFLYRNSKFLG